MTDKGLPETCSCSSFVFQFVKRLARKEEQPAMICPHCGATMEAPDTPCPRCQGAAQPAVMPAARDIDTILVDALGRVGAAANAEGGARYVAQRLGREYHKATRAHGATAAQTIADLANILQNSGEILESRDDGDYFIVSAVVGSGFMNMNPCVLVCIVAPASATSSTIEVAGYAKEGLINQHTAEKAVNAVLQQLSAT